MTETRVDTDFIENVKFTDYMAMLAEKHGPAWQAYRESYAKSINYDTTPYLPKFPVTLGIELVNRCNLKCVMCYTEHHGKRKTTLDEAAIQKVLDECRDNGLPAFVVGLAAEPLLYKGVRDVLRQAKAAGIMDIFLGTNGTLLDEELAEFLVEEQIERIEISVDAATRETYRKIRGKDEFDLVTGNIERLLAVKAARGSRFPIVRLCFCIQGPNIGERRAFLERWKGRVDYIDFQRLVDHGGLTTLIETGDMPGLDEIKLESTYCAYPFNSLHVYSDGNVAPCCAYFGKNKDMILGNVRDTSLVEMWNGERINKLRDEITSGNLNNYCKACLGKQDNRSFAEVAASNAKEGF